MSIGLYPIQSYGEQSYQSRCYFIFQTLNSINTGSIRQRLKNTTKDHGNKQRQSPIPANHLALSSTAPAVLIRSAAIGIPTHKMPPRYQRNSVEGLNQVCTFNMDR